MSLNAVLACWGGLKSVWARPAVRRGCGGALVGLMVVGVAAYVAVPWAVRKVATQQVLSQLGRDLSLGEVRFVPWALALELDDVALMGAGPAAPPALKVAHVLLNLSAASLWRRAPVIESLQIDGVALKLTRISDGHYDLDDILQRWRERPAESEAASTQHFALYNLSVTGLQVEFADLPAGRVHRLEQGLLTVPFLSNQNDEVDVRVEPRLAFDLDGARFDTGAQAKPFAASREAVVTLNLRDVDMAPWLPYWPASLPVRPSQGWWSADVTFSFAQPPGKPASLTLGGRLHTRDHAWTLADGQPLLGWRALSLGVGQVQPLQRQVALDSLKIEGLQGTLRRDPSGQLAVIKALNPASSAQGSVAQEPPVAPKAWSVTLDRLEIPDARWRWNDLSVRPAVNWQAQNIHLRGEQLRWPLPSEVPAKPLSLSGEWSPEGATQASATWQAQAFVGAQGGKFELSLSAWPLAWGTPYHPAALKAQAQGQLGLTGDLQWAASAAAPLQLEARLSRVQIDRLQLSAPGHTAVVAVRQLALDDLGLKWPQQQVSLAKLQLDQPVVKTARSPEGELDLTAWWQPAPEAAVTAVSHQAEPPPWQVKLGLLEWQGGQLAWLDKQVPKAVDLTLSAWSTQVRDLQWPAAKPWAVQGRARLAAAGDQRRQAGGEMRWSGLLAPSPFSWRGKLESDRLPLHLLAPYVPGLPLDIQRAELTWRGQLAASVAEAGPSWLAQGEATVTDFRAMAPGAGAAHAPSGLGERSEEELLSWQTLSLPDLDAQGEPGRPARIKLGEVVLADAFARLVVTEDGRLNLTALAPPATSASASQDTVLSPAAVVASAASGAGQSEPTVLLNVAGLRLQNGRVDFSDRFIRPNYRADLTALNGQLGALSIPSQGPATLALQGRAAGTADLDIRGQVQPFTQPPSLNIEARATDLELAPLTPYAAKYAGYAIERGKLSLKVGYQVQPNGQLQAQNQLILNQLTFGERVESPDATRLPVALAVALLKDRNGVIDLQLPIEGSLNDPQFRIGPVVLKLVLNLLGKAITSPFSLLAGGGGDELSQVAFEPGTAQLSAAARTGLDKVAQALQDRPSLSLTVHTASDLSAEQEALRSAVLAQRLHAERRKELARAGEAVPSGDLLLTEPDRSRLLARLYTDTRLPNKPRNVLGLEKSVSPSEAETLLKAAMTVGPEPMRELALQRGLAVRDALVAKGLSGERIFLAAPAAKGASLADGVVAPSHVAGLALGMP